MNRNQKLLTAATLLAWGLTMVIVPWRLTIVFHNVATLHQVQVGFIWSTPHPHYLPRELFNSITAIHSEIVVSIVILEWVILTVFYLVFLKAYKDLEEEALGGATHPVAHGAHVRRGF